MTPLVGRRALLASGLAAALAAAGCARDEPASTTSVKPGTATAGTPLTVKHQFGSTRIPGRGASSR